MSEYRCYKCETTHTTENMVSCCTSCYAALDTTNRLLTKELEKAREQVQSLTLENVELRQALSGRTVSCGNCSALEARERELVKELEAWKAGEADRAKARMKKFMEIDPARFSTELLAFMNDPAMKVDLLEVMPCGHFLANLDDKRDVCLFCEAVGTIQARLTEETKARSALESEKSLLTKAVEAVRNIRDAMNRGDWDCLDWCDRAHPCPHCRLKIALDAVISPRQPQAETGYCNDMTHQWAGSECFSCGNKVRPPQPPEEGR